MKTILQFFVFFICGFSFAQFELEHTYNENEVTRVNLEIDGEKYYLVNKATSQADFYNADHSFWKSIPLPAPPQPEFYEIKIWHVSQTKINSDSNIEIIYSYNFTSGGNQTNVKVISENGSLLLQINGAFQVFISEIEGLSSKLISYHTSGISKVYSFPELILEKTYFQSYVSRIKLQNSGEKYFLLDTNNELVIVYNSNHTVWKMISLTKPANSYYSFVSLLVDSEINGDDLIKVGYATYYLNGPSYAYTGNIINEDGVNLLTSAGTSSFFLSKLNGLSNKIIARNSITNSNNATTNSSNVYNSLTLGLEHQYESLVARTVLENSGEKYYTTQSPLNNQVKIYNADHSIWKTVDLPIPGESYQVTAISNLSENKFNSYDLVEFTCGYKFDTWGFGTSFESRIVNENGLNLLTVINASRLILSELPNLNNKIIGQINVDGQSQPQSGTVYNTDVLNITNFKKSLITITPNPVKNEFNIFSTNAIVEVTIFDSIGKLILTKKASNLTKIEVQNLYNGIYFAKMKDDNNNQITQKIIISN